MEGAMILKDGLAESLAERLTTMMNGEVQECIVTAFNHAKSVGEDAPAVEALAVLMHQFEAKFNDEALPPMNAARENLMTVEAFVKKFNSLNAAKVNMDADYGTVQQSGYDAAAQL